MYCMAGLDRRAPANPSKGDTEFQSFLVGGDTCSEAKSDKIEREGEGREREKERERERGREGERESEKEDRVRGEGQH